MAKKRQQKQPTPTKAAVRRPRVESGDESKEMLSEWWHDNGKYLIAGAVLAILSIGGWKGWGYYTETRAAEAATYYREMLDQVLFEKAQDANQTLNILRDQYASTTYSVFASFIMAKFKVEQGQMEEAVVDLKWITEHSRYDELKSLAWVRIARLLLELNKTEEAYDIVLSYKFPRGVEELAAEIRGDYLVRQGEFKQATDAYQQAISTSMLDDYNFIMMKMEEIGSELKPVE